VQATSTLPTLSDQAERLIDLGIPDITGITPQRFRKAAGAAPDSDLYVVTDIDRGDHLANWSPDEALPHLIEGGRTPLTLSEGIQWLLHQPEALERNRCFMTIGSRKPAGAGKLDSRTPAIWISNGTGRDGKDNRNAPKVGWCWAGNRHTWLGFASAAYRSPLPAA